MNTTPDAESLFVDIALPSAVRIILKRINSIFTTKMNFTAPICRVGIVEGTLELP